MYVHRFTDRQKTDVKSTKSNGTKVAARISQGFSGVFLALLFLLHVLEPEFDPSWRMISEYALGQYGWLMSLAFFCWGGSVLALLSALWNREETRASMVARGWMIVIAVALVGAGLFQTNPITDPTPRFSHEVHRVCGALVILTFPIAASLVAGRLRQGSIRTSRTLRFLTWSTWVNWLTLLTFFASMIISRVLHPGLERVGPHVLLGFPNRLMVVAYHIWLLIVASYLTKTAAESPESDSLRTAG